MKAEYMLDTNICIYIGKNKPQSVLERFRHLSVNQVVMSVITYGELKVGAEKSQQKKLTLDKLNILIEIIPVIPMSIEVGNIYGTIRANLESKGKIIGNNDLWIAAHALEQNLTLVSNNIKEFERIDQLLLENWV
ncbi:MAG: type II toxin-antitoxin system VapC family toxin [Gammaproteobacteria bacterium]|nr:type II toxin-antitoxin system VapC family toxin [Gammaproteobacteria bacterium]